MTLCTQTVYRRSDRQEGYVKFMKDGVYRCCFDDGYADYTLDDLAFVKPAITVSDIRARMEAHGARYAPPITFVEMLDSLAPHVLESRLILNDEATIRTMNAYRQRVATLRHTIRRLESDLITSQAHTVLQMERAETAEQESARLDSQATDLRLSLAEAIEKKEREQRRARRFFDRWQEKEGKNKELRLDLTEAMEQITTLEDELERVHHIAYEEHDMVYALEYNYMHTPWDRIAVPEPPVRVEQSGYSKAYATWNRLRYEWLVEPDADKRMELSVDIDTARREMKRIFAETNGL